MKKYLFFAAAVAITACTNDTLIDDTRVPDTKEVAIGFATGTNNLTRAENSSATNKKALENYHQTMRVWGYKNIKNNNVGSTSTTGDTYKSTPVFDATKGGTLYANSVATWGESADNDAPFNEVEGNFGGGDWVYSPVRYWDKTATNYDFHAAAPDKDFADPAVIIDWKWNQKMADASAAWDKDAADGKGAGYFTLGEYFTSGTDKTVTTAGITLVGESLPINKVVTGQTADVFGKGTNKDVDLMIAKDVTEYTAFLPTPTATTQRVNFDFNHILSRLNIAVKTTVTKVTNSEGKSTGVVTLESVMVYNLKNSGAFDESLASNDNLAKGTADRWVKGTTTYNDGTKDVGIGFPNKEVEATTTTAPIGIVISEKIAADNTAKTPEMLSDDFKYVFQGLIIPQEVAWKHLAIDGSDVDSDEDIYLEIRYNIDGEEFCAVYNLADVFTANIQYKTESGLAAYKTIAGGNTYAYFDGTNYCDVNGTAYTNVAYQSDGKFYKLDETPLYEGIDGKLYLEDTFSTEFTPGIILAYTNGSATPVKRSEIGGAAADITFCEGWQNTLKITIDPKAILFDADVYEWVTKEEAEVTVE